MNSKLIELLSSYENGDLVAAAEIVETACAIADDPGAEQSARTAAEEIADRFRALVRGGDAAVVEEWRPVWVAALAAPIAADAPEAPATPSDATDDAEPHEVPLEDLDVVSSFIQEAVDHLDDIEHRVLNLEDSYGDDLVNSIFRSIHTIKGVASFIGFSHVSETSHELETLLDDVRNGTQEITEELITVILDGTDVLARIVHSIESQLAAAGSGSVGALVEESFGHRRIVTRVQNIRSKREADREAPVGTPASPGPQAPFELGDTSMVTREMIDAFIEESTDLLDQVEQALLTAEDQPIPHETVDEVFRSIHTVKGNAGFFWFTRVEKSCMEMESALDEYRSRGASISREAAGGFIDSLDTIREALQTVATAAASTDPANAETADSSQGSNQGEAPDALGEILIEMGEVTEESLQRALSSQQRRLGEILVSDEHVEPATVDRALAEQAKRRGSASATAAEYSVTRKDIRVDTNKLDKLFDLVGELITAESMVLGGLHENGNGTNDHASVTKAASYLQKITREMQEITLSIRMIPLEATFGKMRRLVRDLARRFEKDVAIHISGEDTEMDKNVIEEISDPLVHVIRNAIDHGIESRADREAAGKPGTGSIWLSAKHEGNEIWITVQDDGRGLNKEKILKKASERGLVQDDESELTDEQIYRFIFEPAFSTADAVSEISGRGVGMDVVRQNIEKLRGKIDLKSEPGRGSTFVLRIPLTLAILDGVTFGIAGTQYSVPTTDLVTFQRYEPDLITRTGADHHGFRLRDEIIPIVQYERGEEVPEHGVIIVLQSQGRRAALVVDEIIGYRQFVVRAMPGYIQSMRAVSGCSIQGDGSISFIIDVAELVAQELESVGSR